MICGFCHGTGKRLNPRLRQEPTYDGGVQMRGPWGEPLLVPCTECLNGVASCCEAGPVWVDEEFFEE